MHGRNGLGAEEDVQAMSYRDRAKRLENMTREIMSSLPESCRDEALRRADPLLKQLYTDLLMFGRCSVIMDEDGGLKRVDPAERTDPARCEIDPETGEVRELGIMPREGILR